VEESYNSEYVRYLDEGLEEDMRENPEYEAEDEVKRTTVKRRRRMLRTTTSCLHRSNRSESTS
jgi:hypothetical protein